MNTLFITSDSNKTNKQKVLWKVTPTCKRTQQQSTTETVGLTRNDGTDKCLDDEPAQEPASKLHGWSTTQSKRSPSSDHQVTARWDSDPQAPVRGGLLLPGTS